MNDWLLENYRVKCTHQSADGRCCNAPILRAVHQHSTGGYTGELEVCRAELDLHRLRRLPMASDYTSVSHETGALVVTRRCGPLELQCPKCGANHRFSAKEIAGIMFSIQATIDKYQSGIDSAARR